MSGERLQIISTIFISSHQGTYLAKEWILELSTAQAQRQVGSEYNFTYLQLGISEEEQT
jgi:hypothetical protein